MERRYITVIIFRSRRVKCVVRNIIFIDTIPERQHTACNNKNLFLPKI